MHAVKPHLLPSDIKRATPVCLLGADSRLAENDGELSEQDLREIDESFGIVTVPEQNQSTSEKP